MFQQQPQKVSQHGKISKWYDLLKLNNKWVRREIRRDLEPELSLSSSSELLYALFLETSFPKSHVLLNSFCILSIGGPLMSLNIQGMAPCLSFSCRAADCTTHGICLVPSDAWEIKAWKFGALRQRSRSSTCMPFLNREEPSRSGPFPKVLMILKQLSWHAYFYSPMLLFLSVFMASSFLDPWQTEQMDAIETSGPPHAFLSSYCPRGYSLASRLAILEGEVALVEDLRLRLVSCVMC